MEDNKDKGKKKVAKEVVEEKPKTLAQEISDINNAKFTSDRKAAIANRESKLKQQIGRMPCIYYIPCRIYVFLHKIQSSIEEQGQ